MNQKIRLNGTTFTVLFPTLFRPLTEEERSGLEADIRGRRKVLMPVVVDENDGVIDGANRLTIAADCGIEDVPVITAPGLDEAQKRALAIALNKHRRHLTRDELREEIAKELKADPERSNREIARETGAHHETVAAERATLEGRGEIRHVEKTTDAKGRSQPTTKPPSVLCERCKRVGAVEGCNDCKAARKAAKNKRKAAKKKRSAQPTEVTDAFKNPVPKGLLDVWCDPWIQRTYDTLCTVSENFRGERMADGMKKRAKHFPFFEQKDFIDGCGFVIQYLDDLIQHVKEFRPAGVCPACKGAKCTECRHSGLVPRALYGKLKEAAK